MNRCFLLCITGTNNIFFERGFLVTLKSIKMTNPGVPVVVFYENLTLEQKSMLKDCELIEIDTNLFYSEHKKKVTNTAYGRLFINKLKNYDKAIYLDGDTVVLDSLDEIFDISANIIAVKEKPLRWEFADFTLLPNKYKVKKKSYSFCSGFLYFDLRFWRDKDLANDALMLANEFGWEFFSNLDQSMLNLLASKYNDGFTAVSPRYNLMVWREENMYLKVGINAKGLFAPIFKREFAKVVHFGGWKPWKLDAWHIPQKDQQYKYYRGIYEQFRDLPDEEKKFWNRYNELYRQEQRIRMLFSFRRIKWKAIEWRAKYF